MRISSPSASDGRRRHRLALRVPRLAAGLAAASLVAFGGLTPVLGPAAGAATVARAHPAPGPSLATRAAIDKPRGFFYRTDVARRGSAQSGASGQSNPSCGGCQPPLLFTPDSPVMGGVSGTPGHVTITPIYWAPSGYSFTSTYKNIINGYLSNVAAASHTNGNVFAVADQYYQQATGGPVQHIDYAVTAGAEVDVSNAYPAQGGATGCTADSGFTACVADQGLQDEVATTLAGRGLPADDAHLYMVFFPPAVETCQGPGVASDNNPCSTNAYCGYHSAFGSQPAIYANEPYPPLNGCSDPFNGAQAPNGDPEADAALSVVSHEANESITDTYNTWIDGNGYEDGDECSYTYGVPLGSTGVSHPGASGTMYNQTINGAHYFTQDEFSNTDYFMGHGDVNYVGGTVVAGCIQRPNLPPTITTTSLPSGTTGQAYSPPWARREAPLLTPGPWRQGACRPPCN
ncbi:MAG: hypothetical protein ACR2MN_04220 [Acidimicrobiales bacterium]